VTHSIKCGATETSKGSYILRTELHQPVYQQRTYMFPSTGLDDHPSDIWAEDVREQVQDSEVHAELRRRSLLACKIGGKVSS